MALLAGLLNEFYRYDITYFPVIETEEQQDELPHQNTAETSKLLGFLLRSDLDRWVTDIDRLSNSEYGHNLPYQPADADIVIIICLRNKTCHVPRRIAVVDSQSGVITAIGAHIPH